jgi:hypothetical protein
MKNSDKYSDLFMALTYVYVVPRFLRIFTNFWGVSKWNIYNAETSDPPGISRWVTAHA